ncbi:MAG: ATP-dependent Clp protease adaptor ClpS [Cellulosilyticaceae bacterium]
MGTHYQSNQKERIQVKHPKSYKVLMHNDDFTTMEFVVEVLTQIFNQTEAKAHQVMMDVHRVGRGVAGIYSYDIAMTKATLAMSWAKEEGFPFKLTVEEV